MRLDEYSIDDLHQCALNEFEHDIEIQRILNDAYRQAKNAYIVVFERLRKGGKDTIETKDSTSV